jgi:predicted phage terminase large subunit-like protein
MSESTTNIGPQPGPQTQFLSTPADIAFYGGAAGSGKSFATLLDPLRWIDYDVGAIIFRRTMPQITTPGGLWDESVKLYHPLGGDPREHKTEWKLNKLKIKFSEIQYDKDVHKYQGASLPLIYFEELTHFSEHQFFYMLSRNRSTEGLRPYVRGTCNPDPDSWVFQFVEPYIDPSTGLPNRALSGKLRYFIRLDDSLIWSDDRESLEGEYGLPARSFTFIAANIEDNPALTRSDPGYRANLLALPRVERERLLGGNWHIRPKAGLYFKREWLEQREVASTNVERVVRYWDRAATEKKQGNDPDWTVGTKVARLQTGQIEVQDVVRFRESPFRVHENIRRIAEQDGRQVFVGIEQEPGASGKSEAQALIAKLAGFNCKAYSPTGDKVTRAGPVSAQAEAGNVAFIAAKWNEEWLKELENFPEAAHDDQVDSLSGAFEMIQSVKIPRIRALN